MGVGDGNPGTRRKWCPQDLDAGWPPEPTSAFDAGTEPPPSGRKWAQSPMEWEGVPMLLAAVDAIQPRCLGVHVTDHGCPVGQLDTKVSPMEQAERRGRPACQSSI